MTRTFLHSFDPPTASPVAGTSVDLEVSDIEDVGIREVLQTPGAAYGDWSILDALLTPTGVGTPFIFREPLGQAREVKVALSGLFGRFVARAYLERYFNLSIFAHIGSRTDRPHRTRPQGHIETHRDRDALGNGRSRPGRCSPFGSRSSRRRRRPHDHTSCCAASHWGSALMVK